MRRAFLPTVTVLAALVALGGLAYLTHHPDTPWLADAEAWPMVGTAVRAFRARYLPAAAPQAPPEERPVAETAAREEPVVETEVVGEARPMIWLEAGVLLRAAPAADAAVTGRVDALTNVGQLEERGDWRLVLWRGRPGWAHLPAYRDPSPSSAAAEPLLPRPGRPPDPARWAAARTALSPPVREGHLGPYALATDVDDRPLIVLLDGLAGALEGVWRARYGLPLAGDAAEGIVLFRREADYRAFRAASGVPATGGPGHTVEGIVALYREGLRIEEVAITLVHELTHLLNRRGLGPGLPPWLEEGIADDLATAALTPQGLLVPGAIGGLAERDATGTRRYGGLASRALLEAARKSGTLPPVGSLLSLDTEAFATGGEGALRYAHAAFLVRFLLDGGEPRGRSFRAFLATVAHGGSPAGDALLDALGEDAQELDRAFTQWLDALPRGPG